MSRLLTIAAVLFLAACGVDGPPIAPDGAVPEVNEGGTKLVESDGGI